MDNKDILVIFGYILAIFFNVIGAGYGLILYITTDDDSVKKHAIFIMIIGLFVVIIFSVMFFIMGISVLALAPFAG